MTYEHQQEKIHKLQLTSDIFFSVALADNNACQEVIRIITGKPIEVVDVHYQHTILQLMNHSIRIDVWATDEKNNQIGIEMHPQSGENRVKRNRYNIASIDVKTLEKSKPYNDIPDTIGIYITQSDFLRTKKVVNTVVRTIKDTNKEIPNGAFEYYVCLGGTNGTAEQIALMKFILNSNDVTENEYFPNLVKRIRFLKENQEGSKIMCEIMDEIKEEGRAEGRAEGRFESKKEIIIRMIKNHIPEETICLASAITFDELQVMKEQLTNLVIDNVSIN